MNAYLARGVGNWDLIKRTPPTPSSEEGLLFKQTNNKQIRPGTEYCSVVYHSLIPQYISDQLESVQKMAMKIIYGSDVDYGSMVENGTIQLLSERREEAVLQFTLRNEGNTYGQRWFPIANTTHRDIRATTHRKYREEKARTERMRSNPIQYMIRKLNSQ